jgi:hypothetical protein
LATAPSRWTRAFPAAAAVPAGPARLGDKLEILAHTHPAGSTDRFGAELAYVAVVSNAIHLAADTGCVITCPFIPGRLRRTTLWQLRRWCRLVRQAQR